MSREVVSDFYVIREVYYGDDYNVSKEVYSFYILEVYNFYSLDQEPQAVVCEASQTAPTKLQAALNCDHQMVLFGFLSTLSGIVWHCMLRTG